ncbi:MAG: transposase [Alphaproteobacteria bacterium]|nr:transposase [Alphaproteobacteria bacterium]
MNAYSLDLRKLVVAFVEEGHTQAEEARQFKLYPGTISRWIKLKRTTGSLKAVAVPRSPHKLPLDALEKYEKEHPDAFLREIGSHFSCGKDAVARALKKLGFTRKKTKKFTGKGMNRKGKYLLIK